MFFLQTKYVLNKEKGKALSALDDVDDDVGHDGGDM